jgi:hypothetical protein
MRTRLIRKPKATAPSFTADSPELPDRIGCRTARYRARNTSSTTMMPRIRRVSELARRRSSINSLVAMADDEIPTMPAMTSASRLPHPRAKPSTRPPPRLKAR